MFIEYSTTFVIFFGNNIPKFIATSALILANVQIFYNHYLFD